jgi:hypothetical protein
MRRPFAATVLAVVLAAASGGLWLLWAEDEYRGLDSCPYDIPGHGHPALIAVGLIGVVALIAFLPRWGTEGRRSVVASAATGLLAGAAIFVNAIFVGAGLRCMD